MHVDPAVSQLASGTGIDFPRFRIVADRMWPLFIRMQRFTLLATGEREGFPIAAFGAFAAYRRRERLATAPCV